MQSSSSMCMYCGEVFSDISSCLFHEKYCTSTPCFDANAILNDGCDEYFFDPILEPYYTRNPLNLESTSVETCKRKDRDDTDEESDSIKKLKVDDCLYVVTEVEQAFKRRLTTYQIKSVDIRDLSCFLQGAKTLIYNLVLKNRDIHKAIKFNLFAECGFQNVNGDQQTYAFKTKNIPVFRETDVDELLEGSFEKLEKELEEKNLKQSGWSLVSVEKLQLRINKYSPLGGSSYIPLPKEIEKKKACINVNNFNDQKCFMYSILAKFVKKYPYRVHLYRNLGGKYDFSCLTFPTPLNEIKKFEKLNNISINVFGIEKDNQIYPLKVAKEEKEDHRDLLLIESGGNTHYVYIKNFEKLVRSQITKHEHNLQICRMCMTHFDSQGGLASNEKLEAHKIYCGNNKPARIDLPTQKPFIEFEHVERSMRVPFVVYCDFESVLKPIQSCQPNPENSFSNNFQLHEPISFCCYLKVSDEVRGILTDLPTRPYLYRGKDAAKNFITFLKVLGEKVSNIYFRNEPMIPLTGEEETLFQTANLCSLCAKTFSDDDIKVRDHCHITGLFRGATHRSCNLRYQSPSFLPVLLHNLSGYDSHFIVRELGYDDKTIHVIPNTEERYISFSKKVTKNLELRFLDTFRFMSSSLDALARNLPSFPIISDFFPPSKLELLKRKGVFPYDYVSNWEVLNETQLPTKDKFFNKLTDSHITDDDYSHAQRIWSEFNIRTLGEYSDFYLRTDVLLLAEIFETFRTVTLQTHKLDPCHYYTLPGLSWDAMLRFTGMRLQLLTDYDQILMIENGIRGGICQVSHRHVKANNKYLSDYNPHEDSTFITYQDCNNLYGYAMNQSLPYDGFEWIKPEEINLQQLSPDDDEGYILEVDVEYPSEIHDLHNNLPFFPENMRCGKYKKLVPHLGNRKNYVVHYLYLKQAVEHGLVLKKIHKVLKFRQSKWLKPYIDHNTSLRTRAKNNFEKDLYKLYNNSVFGKTMENVRRRIDIRLISNPKKIVKMIKKPEFLDRTIYTENLVAVHLAKKRIRLDKPLYIGLSVLDLSKISMYHYHYDVMLPKYGPERLLLGYVDTDAFIYLIKTHDIFVDFKDMLEYLDTSEYPVGHPCYSKTNAKVVGKFKDEAKGLIISEFIGLRAKMYALKIDGVDYKKAKGVKSTVLKREISFEHYKSSLKEDKIFRHPMGFIRSERHRVTSMIVNKISLSPHDDKRVILGDGISTLAYGHYKLCCSDN